MDAPALVLVPPTPLKFGHEVPSQPPHHRYSQHPSSFLENRRSTLARQSVVSEGVPRSSADNSISSIYSMYGDEQTASTSWESAEPDRFRRSVNHSSSSNNHHKPQSSSFLAYEDSDLAYYDDNSASSPQQAHYKHQQEMSSPRISVATSESSTHHPPSSYATPSSLRANSDLFDDSRSTGGMHFRTSDLSTTSYTTTPGIAHSREFRSGSPNSKHSSRTTASSMLHHQQSLRDLPPLPPSRQTTPSPSTPPRHPSPSPAAGLLTPKTSMKHATGKFSHPPSVLGSPSSKVSLVPSEGEDNDAFHVRNTYAQLEASGVKGDGYEEGVERTRARVGNSRSSQLQADAALGDGTEKTKDLDVKELQVLSSVDRYGFFTITSHDRLVLLHSPPLLKKLSGIPAGPPSANPNPTVVPALPPATVSPKETSRIAKWNRMLVPHKSTQGGNVDSWRIRPSKEAKFRERVYKGIPDRWRRAAWDLMLSRHGNMTPKGYDDLAREYRDGLEKPSSFDVQIDLDVPRTISGHIMFRTRYGAGQRSLFHVLHSFSLRCLDCGYVQGMGPIAATLLCYFEPERVYASLVVLHDASSYNLHTVFSPGFPGMLEAIYIQERITETMMPKVYDAFKKHMIGTTSYATKWYITLFANTVPFQTQLRLWDAFLTEGYDLFVAMAVAIVWVYRDHITSSSANFETILSLLSSFFVPENEDGLMSWISATLADKKLRANMVKWRQEWRGLVAEGKEGAALL